MKLKYERALFMEYGYEPKEFVKLALDIKISGVDIQHNEAIVDSIVSQKIFVNAMIPEIQKKLQTLKNAEKWTGIIYSAEVDEDGNILYFYDIDIISHKEMQENVGILNKRYKMH